MRGSQCWEWVWGRAYPALRCGNWAWEDEGPAPPCPLTPPDHKQESAGEAGAEAGAARGLERGLLPQGTGGASWSGFLVAKVRLETSLVCRQKERGRTIGGAEKGRGLFRSGANGTGPGHLPGRSLTLHQLPAVRVGGFVTR